MALSIDQVFFMISWDRDEATQREGIKEANKIEHLSVFFQPIERKSVWENCAKIIICKSNETLSIYIYQMLEWLRDMNWPGANLIYDRLLQIPASMIKTPFRNSLRVAKLLDDASWRLSLLAFLSDYQQSNKLYEESLGDFSQEDG